MVFSSLTFIYFFLAITVIAYFLLPSLKAKNAVLLLVSLVFYSWGEPKLVILMLLTAGIAYCGGLLIDKFRNEEKLKACKASYIITDVLIISGLLVFKYADFLIQSFGGEGLGLKLPIGISFYTFQILSYVIDLYRGEVKLQKNPLRLLLYVSFFPQLIAGPIVRYQTVQEEIGSRTHSIDEIARGTRRFILGLAKKSIIANGVAQIAELIYAGDPEVYGCGAYWLAAICYALQIYFDFSGYSDMAIGLGRIFGFHFLENFDHPYLANSVTDFWRRWHISLSSWFRDYIYIPLGGNRVSKSRWIFNIMLVWALTGLWHGASWNFVLWGLYYGIFLLIEKLFIGKYLEKTHIIKHIYTLLVVVIGWVIFNLVDPSQMTFALSKMFSFAGTSSFDVITANSQIIKGFIFVPLAIISVFAQPVVDWLEEHEVLANIVSLVLLFVSVVFLLSSSYNPFIYFRF